MATFKNSDVLIVGAGLAGLSCGRRLHEAGIPFSILEAADAPGGRVRTDNVDGFLLDRGFQVFLTSYPEARTVLDYEALDLHPFYPGALVRYASRFHRVSDPWRRPIDSLSGLFSPIGGLTDKLRVGTLRRRLVSMSPEEVFRSPESRTIDALHSYGFSEKMVDRFFRPFLGGILLDRDLTTSSRMFEFIFRALALGDNTLPGRGMQAIPDQLASTLPDGSISTGTRVKAVDNATLTLESGETFAAKAVVVATESPEAARLVAGITPSGSRSVTCLYFSAPEPPIPEPMLVLNGESRGLVDHVCIPSVVAPTYAPSGQALVATTIVGNPELEDKDLEDGVRRQMVEWFGSAVHDWQHLRTYRIRHAQPDQTPPALEPAERPVELSSGLFVCGDHRDNGSLNGAMASGRRAAQAVMDFISA